MLCKLQSAEPTGVDSLFLIQCFPDFRKFEKQRNANIDKVLSQNYSFKSQ